MPCWGFCKVTGCNKIWIQHWLVLECTAVQSFLRALFGCFCSFCQICEIACHYKQGQLFLLPPGRHRTVWLHFMWQIAISGILECLSYCKPANCSAAEMTLSLKLGFLDQAFITCQWYPCIDLLHSLFIISMIRALDSALIANSPWGQIKLGRKPVFNTICYWNCLFRKCWTKLLLLLVDHELLKPYLIWIMLQYV